MVHPADLGHNAGVQTIESCSTTWVFDAERRRFLRVPRGTSVEFASSEGWAPYHALQLSVDDPTFVVMLNESGTRLLRSARHTDECALCAESPTEELSLDDIKATLGT